MSLDNVIYEVNIHVERTRLAEFDEWLHAHVAHMLELPGFVNAQVFESDSTDERALRSVHYRLRDRAALDAYLDEHAGRMRADGADRFGDAISADRRVLSLQQNESVEHCHNCAGLLNGQYCSSCGQRHRNRMISVWELLRDVFEDIISWDSRLWRSMRPLLLSPGLLTNEYLNGRRTYYTPPLRMYLVLSVLFFLLSSVGTFGEIDIDDLDINDDGVAIDIGEDEPALTDEQLPAAFEDRGDGRFKCGDIELDVGLPGIAQETLRARAVETCNRFLAPGGPQAVAREFMDLVPSLLIVMLPLIALASKVLYLFSRRYYVEHLLFFTHYHSFVFLFLMVMAALLWLVSFAPGGDSAGSWLKGGAWLYGIYYLFKSMRRVFGQGRFLTGLKLFLISVTYFTGGLIVAVFGMLIAALSV